MSWTAQQVAITGGTIDNVKITDLPEPINPGDAATKGYVDTIAAPMTNSLGADVSLNNTANYFDGPSVAQGTTGTWFASGTVTLIDTTGTASMFCKLWDGTTLIDSAVSNVVGASGLTSVSLSGYLASPAGNIRISCRDLTNATGKILFNLSGNSKDSTITAYRIA